jgi:hypothetical protein
MLLGRKRRVLIPALVAVSAILLVAGGTYLVIHRTEHTVRSLGCYAGPSLKADTTVVRMTGNPVQVCASLWGDIAPGKVPPLMACVLPSGDVVGVFPGDHALCGKLGLLAYSS